MLLLLKVFDGNDLSIYCDAICETLEYSGRKRAISENKLSSAWTLHRRLPAVLSLPYYLTVTMPNGSIWGQFGDALADSLAGKVRFVYNSFSFGVEEGQFGLIGISPSTIIPWLLGGLLLLVVLTLSITIKSWRESKRFPYFFLRVQASKRMRRYLASTLVLILITVVAAAYAWQAPEDTTTRLAHLSHAKVRRESVVAAEQGGSLADASPATVEISTVSAYGQSATSASGSEGLLQDSLVLPEQYDQVESTSDLAANTSVGPILFSTDISGDYKAVSPSTRFGKGYFTLYATFSYEEMPNGVSWSWVWRRNGEVVDGGNQSWSYGENGPGYVYYRPESGFDLGNYTLEVWVNDDLMAQSSFTVTDAISANN